MTRLVWARAFPVIGAYYRLHGTLASGGMTAKAAKQANGKKPRKQ